MNIYQAISGVQKDLAGMGIAKNKENKMQGYKFRGVDDIYNALSSILPMHGVVILPRMLSRECVERVNQKGTALFYTTVEAEFDIVSTVDGTKHTVKTYGEAMDSGDKSTNKAMSAAYKYACIQSFCIPTEGDNDTENTTHEIASVKKTKLTQPEILSWIKIIFESKNETELKQNYSMAYRLAYGQDDILAVEQFTAAKDQRKAQLESTNV
jgi:hypothetical protein